MTGTWRDSGLRIYVDIEMDRSFRTSRALIALSGGTSSEGERITKDVADTRPRQRWRKTETEATALSSSSSSVSSTSSGR